MKLALYVLGSFLILVTLLPFVRTGAWWVRVWDFPRAQIAVALAVVMASFVFVLDGSSPFDWTFLMIMATALAYQLFRVRPYTRLARPQTMRVRNPDGSRCLRILIANVLMTNRGADRLLAIVRAAEPDVVLTVETDGWWADRLAALDADYRHAVKHPRDNTYGMLLFSRLPLRGVELSFLVQNDIPSIHAEIGLPSGDWIAFHGLHPEPPQPGNDTEERDAELLIVGKAVADDDRPTVVAGDLNDVAWSDTTRLFQRISGMLDPRIGRGLYPTFNANWPLLRWPLDHVFLSRHFELSMLRKLDHFGSDHFPVLVELCYKPDARVGQVPPRPDREERERAREAIAEGVESGRTSTARG
ncbi:MAG TPA: endonuclease/exonuclease/phosphatase family protein [Alphaproteobacteria bacterium]|nr:endonuclease/exonuclease/phosphatase family protein [Alphaproteobacteria bacterium]